MPGMSLVNGAGMILEILIILALLFSPLIRARGAPASYLSLAALTLYILQYPNRWMMLPAMLMGLVWVLVRPHKKPYIWLPLGALIALPAPLLFPLFELPDPTGPHQIGTQIFNLEDHWRMESLGKNPGGPRHIMVQSFYPAQVDGEKTVGYFSDSGVGRQIAKSLGVAPFLFDHISDIDGHSHQDAQALDGEWPVILFNHGLTEGFITQNLSLFEEWASHGYVVISIGHSHETSLAYDESGTLIPIDRDYAEDTYREIKETRDLRVDYLNAGDLNTRNALGEALFGHLPRLDASSARWIADMAFIRTWLAQDGVKSQAHGHMDLDKLALTGMSFGGAAALGACKTLPKIQACLNLDGMPYGPALVDANLTMPLMVLNGSRFPSANDGPFLSAKDHAWALSIAGSQHFDFSDISLWSPLFRWAGLLGPIGGQRMVKILRAYSMAFFNHSLKGAKTPAILAPENMPSTDFPEVELRYQAPAKIGD